MLPYFEQPAWQVGPLTIRAFGVAVAVALWLGLTRAQREFLVRGLDPVIGYRLGGWIVAGGVIGAHLFAVLLYVPQKLDNDPWLLVRVWEDISSFGGILGGVIGAYLYSLVRLRDADWRPMLPYLDVVACVFPASLAIGRVGCALAHDHPGVVTSFPLAVSLESESARAYISGVYDSANRALPSVAPTLGFHDLGLYEFVFLATIVVPAFVMWSQRRRQPGYYLIAFSALYFPVRFALDMLRVADARYLGLTPAQWTAALIMAALPFAAVRQRRLRMAIVGAVVLVTACACWGGT
jgi:phosphatidylglycerol:prolipoprotein diacylglycerol transferase